MVAVAPFDADVFLSRPLVCHLATAGPTVRPVWFLWEDGCLWILSGPWARLPQIVRRSPAVVAVIDTCDLATGETLQVVVHGAAAVVRFDADRGHRLLARYLGGDERHWDERFRAYLRDPTAVWVTITPSRVRSEDLSFRPTAGPSP